MGKYLANNRVSAILVNGPISSGKSTLCRALQDRLTDLADGNPDAEFARVAFDDVLPLMSDKLYPVSFVRLKGGDLARLVSPTPHVGRGSWESIDESDAEGRHGGSPRLRLVHSPHACCLLPRLHGSWGVHLELGTNLVIDHFLQDKSWSEEILEVLRRANARLFCLGYFARWVSESDGNLREAMAGWRAGRLGWRAGVTNSATHPSWTTTSP